MSKVAILSDSHDNLASLERALAQVRESGAELLLHCGDLCAPFVIHRLAEGFTGPIHVIFGNNDADGRLLQANSAGHEHLHLHGVYHEMEFAGRRIAMIHYPEPARRIAESGHIDLTCYGHDHTRHIEDIHGHWLLNPGEIMGMKGPATWALYDTGRHEVEHVMVDADGQ